MRLKAVNCLLATLITFSTATAWGVDYLYKPQPAEEGLTGEGVLVREVTVKRGDSLSRISRQHSGRGDYYPQILLFNDIKNPHRIQTGQLLRVPVSHNSQPVTVEGKKDGKKTGGKRYLKGLKKGQKQQQPGTELFRQGMESYRKGDCETALKLLDRFISQHSSSKLLPDATLARAECYLKLSGR